MLKFLFPALGLGRAARMHALDAGLAQLASCTHAEFPLCWSLVLWGPLKLRWTLSSSTQSQVLF